MIHRKAFTLIELLIVIAILGIAFAIMSSIVGGGCQSTTQPVASGLHYCQHKYEQYDSDGDIQLFVELIPVTINNEESGPVQVMQCSTNIFNGTNANNLYAQFSPGSHYNVSWQAGMWGSPPQITSVARAQSPVKPAKVEAESGI